MIISVKIIIVIIDCCLKLLLLGLVALFPMSCMKGYYYYIMLKLFCHFLRCKCGCDNFQRRLQCFKCGLSKAGNNLHCTFCFCSICWKVHRLRIFIWFL